ncbi:concanavalin A-like lectin/glucanase [Hypoxylon sp. EC38]|nr:concanavalin A-like lectin/glucanase [Hypoxylon sp. EC38]
MVYIRLFRPLVAISSLTSLSMAAYTEVSDDQCNCYLTNTSTGHYFTTHKFFDFRDKADYAKVPDLIEDPDDTTEADVTSDYFSSEEWTDNWALQSWNNTAALASDDRDSTAFMVHSSNNVYLEKNQDQDANSDTFLTLRTARLEDFQSAAEFESVARNYHFLSARIYARTIGDPGAITAMFTYRDTSGEGALSAIQESDLEIRTIDPHDRIQYTNQPSSTPSGDENLEATRNATVPNERDWTTWAVYRMDWSPDSTTWYINGEQVASITVQTPRDPSMIIFNNWSDGGSWSGNMSVGSAAYFNIQWMELVYNTTGPPIPETSKNKRSTTDTLSNLKKVFEKRDDGSCLNICSIDETQKTGTPVLIQNSASKMMGQTGFLGGVLFWVTVLSTALALW